VVVLDRSAEALEMLDHPNKVVADRQALPFRDNRFDNIWACGVVQYVDLDTFVREAVRVTKKGGHILVLVPNAKSPWDKIKKLLGMKTWWDQEGIARQYSVDELKKYGRVGGRSSFCPSSGC